MFKQITTLMLASSLNKSSIIEIVECDKYRMVMTNRGEWQKKKKTAP